MGICGEEGGDIEIAIKDVSVRRSGLNSSRQDRSQSLVGSRVRDLLTSWTAISLLVMAVLRRLC